MDSLLQLQPSDDGEWTVWQTIKSDPGKAVLESVKGVVSRLQIVKEIGLPDTLFKEVSPKLLERYAKRAAVEEPFELRRHTTPLRATLMAVFLHRRTEELTDHLVDLLVETVHKIGKKAESRIDEGLSEALQKAPSKMAKLYRIGKAIKTIFLCRYLDLEELRREIHEGLNVVESWNSTNGFIYYGKRGEISTNRKDNQEMGLLCLHLLQASRSTSTP